MVMTLTISPVARLTVRDGAKLLRPRHPLEHRNHVLDPPFALPLR
jgi:hypothetical protein